MKRFRVYLLLAFVLTLFAYHSQVLAQENSDEIISSSIVQPSVEDKTSESIPVEEDLPPSGVVNEDKPAKLVSNEPVGQEATDQRK